MSGMPSTINITEATVGMAQNVSTKAQRHSSYHYQPPQFNYVIISKKYNPVTTDQVRSNLRAYYVQWHPVCVLHCDWDCYIKCVVTLLQQCTQEQGEQMHKSDFKLGGGRCRQLAGGEHEKALKHSIAKQLIHQALRDWLHPEALAATDKTPFFMFLGLSGLGSILRG